MIFRHFQVRRPPMKWVEILPGGIRWETLDNLDPPSEEDRHITWRNIR